MSGDSLSLTALFNKSFSLGEVPHEWKEANLAPIPKQGGVYEVSNYRCFPCCL